MEWREVEIEPRLKQRRGCWIVAGLLVLGVGAMVVGGLFAAWQAGALPIPFPFHTGEGTAAATTAAAAVVVEPVEGGMEIVALLLPRPLMVEGATLYLESGDRVASLVLPGERRAVIFFTAAGERWRRIEIETPVGVIIQRR